MFIFNRNEGAREKKFFFTTFQSLNYKIHQTCADTVRVEMWMKSISQLKGRKMWLILIHHMKQKVRKDIQGRKFLRVRKFSNIYEKSNRSLHVRWREKSISLLTFKEMPKVVENLINVLTFEFLRKRIWIIIRTKPFRLWNSIFLIYIKARKLRTRMP